VSTGGIGGRVAALRRRLPRLDHAVRAFGRYQADGGDRLAGAVTYYGFLSLFPVIALSFSVLGFVLENNPEVRRELTDTLAENLPGLVSTSPGDGGINFERIASARQSAGIVGLAGLLYAGLGWIDALRQAIRSLWHQNVTAGNLVVRKLRDVVILAGLGATLAASLVATGLVSGATSVVLDLLGVDSDNLGARVLLRLVTYAAALLVDVAMFAYLFTRLPRLRAPLRRVLSGALLASVGFEILKIVGSFYVTRTLQNPVYGSFAVAVGALVWINLVSRLALFCATWTVTAPGDSDVEPSGTASREAAEQAGIPAHFADPPAGDPTPALTQDGAPTPLWAAVSGKPDSDVYPRTGDDQTGDDQTGDDRTGDSRASADRTGAHRTGAEQAGTRATSTGGRVHSRVLLTVVALRTVFSRR